MKREDFLKIMLALDERIDKCEEHFEGIGTEITFEDITIKRAKLMIEFSKVEIDVMTKIAMVDLYHIIGMGNLSSSQMSKFNSKMTKYLSYRPLIKATLAHFKNIYDIPSSSKDRKFVLQGLCDLTLSLEEDCENDDSSLKDYTDTKFKATTDLSDSTKYCKEVSDLFDSKGSEILTRDGSFEILPTTLHIRVCKDRAIEFEHHMRYNMKMAFSFKYIRAYPKSVCGIIWYGDDEKYYYGKIKTSAHMHVLLKK